MAVLAISKVFYLCLKDPNCYNNPLRESRILSFEKYDFYFGIVKYREMLEKRVQAISGRDYSTILIQIYNACIIRICYNGISKSPEGFR